MSDEEKENQGTGLRDVYDILAHATPERVQSLTFQLGESPEDKILHAFCLIILQREEQALNKLQMLGDNRLANHLADVWKRSDSKSEDFALSCGSCQQLPGDSLAALARIFRILSEHRLCDPHRRNLAYQRALSVDISEGLEYDPLREEAKDVCGPQFAAWLSSSRLGSPCDEGEPTLKVSQEPSAQMHGQSLASSDGLSYPSHLEMSLPPTDAYEGDKTSKMNQQSTATPLPGGKGAPEQLKLSHPRPFEGRNHSHADAVCAAGCRGSDELFIQHVPPKQTLSLPVTVPKRPQAHATSASPPKKNVTRDSKGADEQNEDIFYAFVILHAPEDADVAESMKDNLERIIGSVGATFAEDFAIPGRSTLRCVEDAINNSAFTLLLLTKNFNTRMLEMETDSALINSINKQHKSNSVIPILPLENSLPRHCMPIVLQTLVALEENRNFERKIKKALSPASIGHQRRIWTEERRTREMLNQHHKHSNQAHITSELLERLNFFGPSVPSVWQQQPNIHIENAKYIMIGNDSQMTVDYGGDTDSDGSCRKEADE